MRYIIPLLSYGLIVLLLCFAAKEFRGKNPKYSIIDDILLFGGMPVTFGYYLYVMVDPRNDLRLVSDVMDEHRTTLMVLLAWMLISSIIFLWRNLSRKSKLPGREETIPLFFITKSYQFVYNLHTSQAYELIYGPSRNPDYPSSGEINAIYILPEYQKLGIGKKLFLAGIEELIKLGYNDMIINVLKGNNAINFYKKYGGTVVGERSDEIGKITIYEDILYFENIESIH